MAIFSPK
jgi:hypothetical protein